MKTKIAALAVLASTLTACEYFQDVTIPLLDFTAPTAWTSVYFNGMHQDISGGVANAINYEMSDPNTYFLIIGASTDNGGSARVDLNWEVEHFCTSGDLGQIKNALKVPGWATQSGNVGDQVSNGVWAGELIRFSNMANPCSPGWQWVASTVYWQAVAEDFHGNQSSHGWSRVVHYW